jgi:tetratricopeptide (TPR) repeat protein
MLTPPRRFGAYGLAAAIALMLLAMGAGWWLGQRSGANRSTGDPRQTILEKEINGLVQREERHESSDTDRQRLLELLVGLGRQQEAIALLEPMADREPERWSLRLMLAELRRGSGDPTGAERELRQILSRQPHQVEALELMSLLQLEQGKGNLALRQVQAAFTATTTPGIKPQALGLGLLLAEIQDRMGQAPQAKATYQKLAGAFPEDPRPMVALALLLQKSGDTPAALTALKNAKQRSGKTGSADPVLDQLAANWSLLLARSQPNAANSKQGGGVASSPTVQPNLGGSLPAPAIQNP